MPDQLVFTVSGESATRTDSVSLAEAGLLERQHLQEWIIAYPSILSPAEGAAEPSVLIITSEFDRWTASKGPDPLDRLDVLGLDRSGRLVIAELKRDLAPESVTLQAITYAALASRFSSDDVVDAYVRHCQRRQQTPVDREQAADELQRHCNEQMTAESLARPRIVLVAAGFPTTVKATTVWLTEMGLDITLVQVHAYRVDRDRIVVTASQAYPLPDVEEFTVRPRRHEVAEAAVAFPHIAWTTDDIRRFSEHVSPTVRTIMDRCSTTPGLPMTLLTVVEATGRTQGQVQGDLAALTVLVKRKFGRRNWPLSWVQAPGGGSAYVMDEEQAASWRAVSSDDPLDEGAGDQTGHQHRAGGEVSVAPNDRFTAAPQPPALSTQ